MEPIKLNKKFRLVCYEIMDGSYESIEKLDEFSEYPHQVMAVKAEVAFFDKEKLPPKESFLRGNYEPIEKYFSGNLEPEVL